MKTMIIAVILSATAAFATATWVYLPEQREPVSQSAVSFDAKLPDAERIAVLEQAVEQERYARQLLQEEVIVLNEAIETLRIGDPGVPGTVKEEAVAENVPSSREERRERFARRNSPEARTDRLIEAGIDVGLAGWIVQREQELQMESLQARYEAGRTGDMSDYYRERGSTSETLRSELGDTDYERYLVANGRSTSVGVSSVIGSSPAQSAGLQPGDQITRYDGERVFSMTDITNASLTGSAGQNIVMEILRDGQPMQVVIPRGPLGITGGRTRR